MKKFFLTGILILGIIGCAAKTKEHSSTGVIQEIKNSGQVLIIQHEEFPGFMEAMTMPFDLEKPELSQGLVVGDKVSFTISDRSGSWRVSAISKTQ